MTKQGGFFYSIKIIIILAVMSAGFFYGLEIRAAEKININTATAVELDSLPGIGLAKAQAIIDYRAVHPFQTIEDIMKVSGIKQATFNDIKDLISAGAAVNNQSGVNNQASSTSAQTGNTMASTSSVQAADNTASTTALSPISSAGINKGENNFGDWVVNEFVSDPADNDVEWIELYNKSGREIDLNGWWIEDGSKAKTRLDGVIAVKGFKVAEKPVGILNNDGDLIVLYDPSGKIIDQVAYGSWDDGNTKDNAPVAHDPDGVARIFDGYNTFNNSNDFAVTIKPTKGVSNIIQPEDEVSAAAKAKFDFSNDIFISEIFPDPVGDDSRGEFIELYNAGKRAADLTGWSLSNEDNKKKYIEKIATSTIISPGEYLVLFRPKTKIVLHNDQGEVKLYPPLADQPRQTVKYKDVAEGWSYNNENITNGDNNWAWSEAPTPGQANAIKTANHAPEVAFSFPKQILVGQSIEFDSSDTADADGDNLTYDWDFGDGIKNNLANPQHAFMKTGIYKVKLAVSDGKETTEKVKSVKVAFLAALPLPASAGQESEAVLSESVLGGGSKVIINEILPNPKGTDKGQEWLELKNSGGGKINLLNWRAENSNGKYKFKNDLWLEPGRFYLLKDSESKLTLKNSSDTVSLYNDRNELADQIEYADAIEGESYSLGLNGRWFWTTTLTPGAENVIRVAESAATSNSGLGNGNPDSGIRKNANSYLETALAKVRDMEIGSLVKVSGLVAVEPGVLGAQIFYIISPAGIQIKPPTADNNNKIILASAVASNTEISQSAPAGLQIYNYQKDFPALRIGDLVEVSGQVSQSSNVIRLKTKNKTDIKIIKQQQTVKPLELSVDKISEESIGLLVLVNGEITAKKGNNLYLDDGSNEMIIYAKKSAGIKLTDIKAGDQAAVTGIVDITAAGLRLLPRRQDDIRVTPVSSASDQGGDPRVLGEVAVSDQWQLPTRDKKTELFNYLLIVVGGLIIVLIGVIIRYRLKYRKK